MFPRNKPTDAKQALLEKVRQGNDEMLKQQRKESGNQNTNKNKNTNN